MRSTIVKSAVLAGAVLLMAGGRAYATETTLIDVKVPFPFLVNGQTFPAGQYAIERDFLAPSVLLIRDMHGPQSTFVTTLPAAGPGPGDPTLVFTRHEKQYRLSGVWESAGEGQILTK